METAQENQETEQTKQEKKRKISYEDILKICPIVAKEFFIFSLVFYLLLFVLETIFPSFVSNNFNLNWVLGIVLVLGVISAFAPEEKESASADLPAGKAGATADKKPKIVDYLTSIFLGILGGSLIFYKIQLSLTPRLIITFISTTLIIGLSLVLLIVEDEEIKEKEEEIETFVKETFVSRKTFITPIAFFRLLLFKKVNFPVFLIIIAFLFTALALPQKTGTPPRKLNLDKLTSFFKSTPTSEKKVEPSPTPTSVERSEKRVKPSLNLMIKVLNGGGEEKAIADFVKILKDTGFGEVFFGKADNLKYKNATIRFRPEDKEQASLIKDLLQDDYLIISEAPSGTSSAEITVILGAKEAGKTEAKIEEGITILTPEE